MENESFVLPEMGQYFVFGVYFDPTYTQAVLDPQTFARANKLSQKFNRFDGLSIEANLIIKDGSKSKEELTLRRCNNNDIEKLKE